MSHVEAVNLEIVARKRNRLAISSSGSIVFIISCTFAVGEVQMHVQETFHSYDSGQGLHVLQVPLSVSLLSFFQRSFSLFDCDSTCILRQNSVRL